MNIKSSIDRALRYLRYRRASVSRHGVHSPHLYSYIEEVLRGKLAPDNSADIERIRGRLKESDASLDFIEMGAATSQGGSKPLADIAKKSLSSPAQCRILYRTARHFGVRQILEVGTSLGISTAYLAAADGAHVHTIEGNSSVLSTAEEVWSELGIGSRITSHLGAFSDTLPSVVSGMPTVDMVYVDGDHSLEGTLRHLEMVLPHCHERTVLVFDDIHWSEEMEEAWSRICADERAVLTVDCFWMGLVFLNPTLSSQHFTIRY